MLLISYLGQSFKREKILSPNDCPASTKKKKKKKKKASGHCFVVTTPEPCRNTKMRSEKRGINSHPPLGSFHWKNCVLTSTVCGWNDTRCNACREVLKTAWSHDLSPKWDLGHFGHLDQFYIETINLGTWKHSWAIRRRGRGVRKLNLGGGCYEQNLFGKKKDSSNIGINVK